MIKRCYKKKKQKNNSLNSYKRNKKIIPDNHKKG